MQMGVFLSTPFTEPAAKACISSPESSQYMGPLGKVLGLVDGLLEGSQEITLSRAGSGRGSSPQEKGRVPPYFMGMLVGSMNDSRVDFMSCVERMKILEVVIGSNHFLIQDQTVGKKEGAPMIWFMISLGSFQKVFGMIGRMIERSTIEERTHKYSIQRLRIMRRSQCTSILHMTPQIPELLQSHPTDIHNIITLCDRSIRILPISERSAKRHDKTRQILVQREQSK